MKHRVRRALAAIAVLASSLVGTSVLVAAPPAQAQGSSYSGWYDQMNVKGGWRGTAFTKTDYECLDGNGNIVGYIEEAISLSIGDINPWLPDPSSYLYSPGGTATLRLEEYVQKDPGCPSYTPGQANGVTVSIRYMKPDPTPTIGSKIGGSGATEWPVTPSGQNWVYTHQIEFDTNPLNGSVGTSLAGSFELYFTATAPGGASFDTRGNYVEGTGPLLNFNQAGYLVASNGMMAGEDPASNGFTGLSADETAIGKTMPVTRVFRSTWGNPCSTSCTSGNGDVDNFTSQGRLVMWSNKPTFTPSANHTVWYDIANGTKDSGAGNLDDQITTLANMATAAGAPAQAVLIFGHEPHNDTDFAGQTDACEPSCFGSDLEFRAAFKHVHDRIVALGKSNIVKLAYTAVDSKAVASGNDGISGGSNVIGGGDKLYPGNPNRKCNLANTTACSSSNVDLLAHDVYNYYAYWAGHGGPPNYNATGTWKPLKDKLLSATDGQIPLAKRLGKKLLIAEMGSHPGCQFGDTAEGCSGISTLSQEQCGYYLGSPQYCSVNRTTWFTNGLLAVEQDTDALQYLLGFSYFHKNADWDWRFINSTNQTLDSFHQRGTGQSASYPLTGWVGMVVANANFKTTPLSL